MIDPRFETLCRNVCAAAGMEPGEPDLQPEGIASLSLQVGGVVASLVHAPDSAPDSVIALVDLGTAEGDDALDCATGLLDMNFLLPVGRGMSLGRFAESGAVVLQSIQDLDTIDAQGVLRLLLEAADVAETWRQDLCGERGLHPATDQAAPVPQVCPAAGTVA